MKRGLNTTHTNRNQVYRKPNYGLGNDRFPSRRDGGILSDSSGRVPKWSKGTDCKSVIRGFESHRGLYPGFPPGFFMRRLGWRPSGTLYEDPCDTCC